MISVHDSAHFIAQNSDYVKVNDEGCRKAAEEIYAEMKAQNYSMATWSDHPLNPKVEEWKDDRAIVDWIFTIDLLNFSFWSDFDDKDSGRPESQRYTVEYEGKYYTGYWSLVAAVNKALKNGIPITTPSFWTSSQFTPEFLRNRVFHSATLETIPMLEQRYRVMVEASTSLSKFGTDSFADFVTEAKGSAMHLLSIVATRISSFNDVSIYKTHQVSIMKRAQILISDIWACFQGKSYGAFRDIDKLTMFADYRVPQILNSLHCLTYSEELVGELKSHRLIEHGDPWEVELRGCSIWAVEVIKHYIIQSHPESAGVINSVLLDFYLWDTAKRIQQQKGGDGGSIPCHRTRSIYY
ncbi:hypothetical protein TRVA0_016S00518 [Trichomonascus vanleenenianus]|uniref:queuosine 5'-phosphate N-glycosylase/hydrolase n=1 Tax=Trichomonascus vanleenenianus TaxID=2268995 RepID=UPI003ECB0B19